MTKTVKRRIYIYQFAVFEKRIKNSSKLPEFLKFRQIKAKMYYIR